MTKKEKKAPKTSQRASSPKTEEVTGTYVFDKKTGKIVKLSGRVPKVSSKSGKGASDMPGPCGMGPCGGGACPYK